MYNLKQIRIINKLNTTLDSYYKAALKAITIYVKLYNNKYLEPVGSYQNQFKSKKYKLEACLKNRKLVNEYLCKFFRPVIYHRHYVSKDPISNCSDFSFSNPYIARPAFCCLNVKSITDLRHCTLHPKVLTFYTANKRPHNIELK